MDFETLNALEEGKELVLAFQNWVKCPEHEKEYQLLRFDHKDGTVMEPENEGSGLKEVGLSPRQVSKEKKNILLRKISYGFEKK